MVFDPMQDQAIAIVTELCEANRLERIDYQVQDICCLLLQIMEMALYLELCVLQICGIRPVLGRVEDFSKELKLLIRGTNHFIPLGSRCPNFLVANSNFVVLFVLCSNRRPCFSKSIHEVVETYSIVCLSGIITVRGSIVKKFWMQLNSVGLNFVDI